MNLSGIPPQWKTELREVLQSDSFHHLMTFVDEERRQFQVFPPEPDVFRALQLTLPDQVRVVLLGQDPYHDDGQAHGLSFSVPPGIRHPPSLRNIFLELRDDLGIAPSVNGCLESWARQGILLLNTVLTVRAHEAHSHRNQGWEILTGRVIDCVNSGPSAAFVLWGNHAGRFAEAIDGRHLVIQSAHPSPLSARRGFFGSRPFSRINRFLTGLGQPPIDWELPAA